MSETLQDKWGLPSNTDADDRGRLPTESDTRQLSKIFAHIAPPPDDAASVRRASVSELRRLLRHAANVRPLDGAARGIEAIWSDVDELSGFSEALMRLIIREIDPPKLAEEPEWLTSAVRSLHGDSEADVEADARALESARSIVRAVIFVDPTAQAELDVAPSRGVELTWTHAHGERVAPPKRWIVGVSRLPWPGVRVRVYERRVREEPRLDARTHFLAAALVKEFMKP